MNQPFFEVIKAGLATSVQDGGRNGYYHLGIPPSGALDQLSMRAANLLLGNAEDAAVLECALMAPQLRFAQKTHIVITGAHMDPSINGTKQALNSVLEVPAGAELSFGFVKFGARIYIAVAGGIDVPVVLGSRSTYTLGAIGGLQGRTLQAGDKLPIGKTTHTPKVGAQLPEEFTFKASAHTELRVIAGLYDYRLSTESAQSFYDDTWAVTTEADRIGYRYKGGHVLKWKERAQPFGAGADLSNITDACYPIGSIQVPGGLEPIVLHRDAVSGGGYAMIGTVISVDLDKVGQMQPNQKVRFRKVNMPEALDARRAYHAKMDKLRTALR